MNTKLASGDLGKRKVKFLEKRIALLESKPLPTQEQINWRKENRKAVKSSRGQKGEKSCREEEKIPAKEKKFINFNSISFV